MKQLETEPKATKLTAIGWNKNREDWHYMATTCQANIPDSKFPIVVELITNKPNLTKEMVLYRGADITKDRFIYE